MTMKEILKLRRELANARGAIKTAEDIINNIWVRWDHKAQECLFGEEAVDEDGYEFVRQCTCK